MSLRFFDICFPQAVAFVGALSLGQTGRAFAADDMTCDFTGYARAEFDLHMPSGAVERIKMTRIYPGSFTPSADYRPSPSPTPEEEAAYLIVNHQRLDDELLEDICDGYTINWQIRGCTSVASDRGPVWISDVSTVKPGYSKPVITCKSL